MLFFIACTNNNSVGSFEEDGNDCALKVSTSLLFHQTNSPADLSKSRQAGGPLFSDDLPENSNIGLCVYRCGRFQSILTDPYQSDNKAENILSVKKNSEWQNKTAIQLREPANVYAYFPYSEKNFIPAQANNPDSSSDDIAPAIIIKPGYTDYLYGRAEKNGNGILDVITPKKNQATIRFNHAMALIVFSIRKDSDTDEHTLQEIQLNNIASEAHLALNDGSVIYPAIQPPATALKISEYSNNKYQPIVQTAITESGTGDYNADHTDIENNIPKYHAFVIPQTLDRQNTCSLKIHGKNYLVCLTTPGHSEWQSGICYVYTLKLKRNNEIIVEEVNTHPL